MHLSLYLKMALQNIHNTKRIYVPFILSSSGIIALLYVVASLTNNQSFKNTLAGEYISSFLSIGQYVVVLFALIFLFYINSFMIKRRKKELGLYHVLGLEKRHIVLIILTEILICLATSLLGGIIIGIIFEKALFLIILKMMKEEVIFGWMLSYEAIIFTSVVASSIFALLFGYSAYEVSKASTVELLKARNTGEKEPKAKWLLAILGVICLLAGYRIATMTDIAVEAMMYFFPAVFLVIIGTYLLFICGSIALLKVLKKSKKFYYKTNHFITISNMIYRMKKNAVGLASICILSTMILVMLSSTTSLYFSLEKTISNVYPTDYIFTTLHKEALSSNKETFTEIIKRNHLEISYFDEISTLSTSGFIDGNEISYSNEYNDYDLLQKIIITSYLTQEDYNDLASNKISLKEDEVLVLSEDKLFKDELKVGNNTYQIKDQHQNDMINFPGSNNVTGKEVIVVVQNDDILKRIDKIQRDVYGEFASPIKYQLLFNVKGDDDPYKIMNDLEMTVDTLPRDGILDSKELNFNDLKGFYSGFLFLGIFLGVSFMIAIVLIIYYKQISEGDEDKERFIIMQKIGLTDKEIRKTINYQILLVFFAPLLVSIIHLCVAYKPISLILIALSQRDSSMFIYTFTYSIIGFVILYMIVFILTSKTYYRIVASGKKI